MNKMMMNNNEEFSFPVISNNPLSNFMLSSSSASSSSLWRISSRVYHHPEDYEEEHNYDDSMEVRSMCDEILPSNRREIESFTGRDFEVEVEERMDYLWEDFNEEDEVKERKSIDNGEKISRVLKVSKMMGRYSSGDNRNNSSSKMLVIGKLLKGLVSIRKSSQLNKFLKSRF